MRLGIHCLINDCSVTFSVESEDYFAWLLGQLSLQGVDRVRVYGCDSGLREFGGEWFPTYVQESKQ